MNKDLFETLDSIGNIGDLPIQLVAKHNNLAAMEYLLRLHPESASVHNLEDANILNCVFGDDDYSPEMEVKVSYICRRYPNLICERNINGYTPLNSSLSVFSIYSFKCVAAICNTNKQAIIDTVI